MSPVLQGAVAGLERWTPAEDDVLRRTYPAGSEAAAKALPRRSRVAIYGRAQDLGLSLRRRWTRSDDAQLRDLWDLGMQVRAIATRLGRTALTVYWRAQKLGLPLGCPDGWEYLTAAAERTGYATKQLRPILAWAGVSLRRALARPNKKVARACHFVDPLEVDAAIAKWTASEPVHTAAARLGICAGTLERWLERAGFPCQRRAFRCHWRVTEEQIAKALEARAAGICGRCGVAGHDGRSCPTRRAA